MAAQSSPILSASAVLKTTGGCGFVAIFKLMLS